MSLIPRVSGTVWGDGFWDDGGGDDPVVPVVRPGQLYVQIRQLYARMYNQLYLQMLPHSSGQYLS